MQNNVEENDHKERNKWKGNLYRLSIKRDFSSGRGLIRLLMSLSN